ncbi:MAG: hypothetical protein IJM68_00755 [Synergistaceae bacterium]|nr:hypothetical protein [Synergistaceae bacterium]
MLTLLFVVIILYSLYCIFKLYTETKKHTEYKHNKTTYLNSIENGASLRDAYDLSQCLKLCRKLEIETSMYIECPLELDITEVWKFCVALIGINESLGDKRDTRLRGLMSYFADVQNFLLKGLEKRCFEFFQEAWLLKECEILFKNRNGTVLEKVRQSISVRDKARYDAERNVEIYYQRIQHPLLRYPHRWESAESNDYRKMFNNRFVSQRSMERIDNYVDIFWYTYEEELVESERLQEIRENEGPFNSFRGNNNEYLLQIMEIRSTQRAHNQRIIRNKALRIYLRCLSDVLSYTCLPIIDKFARSQFKANWANAVQQQFGVGLAYEEYTNPHQWQPAPSQPQFTKHEHKDVTTTNSTTPVADLLAALKRGACIYLSGAVVLESVSIRGKKCVEISGLEGEHRETVLSKGGKVVRIGDKEHMLMTLGNVSAMEYILSKSRVLNIFDATARELIS